MTEFPSSNKPERLDSKIIQFTPKITTLPLQQRSDSLQGVRLLPKPTDSTSNDRSEPSVPVERVPSGAEIFQKKLKEKVAAMLAAIRHRD